MILVVMKGQMEFSCVATVKVPKIESLTSVAARKNPHRGSPRKATVHVRRTFYLVGDGVQYNCGLVATFSLCEGSSL